jgi:hypothetical protein
MLIKWVYQADPLLCPRCGGTMKIVAFIEARRSDIVRKILEHCGLWQAPSSRSPPPATRPSQPGDHLPNADSRLTYGADPDFQEHARREQLQRLLDGADTARRYGPLERLAR